MQLNTGYAAHNVILFVKYENIENIHNFKRGEFDRRAKFLVILIGEENTRKMARETFKKFQKSDVKDVLLLVQNVSTKAVKLYTWLPYKPPSGKCGRYIKALRLDIWKNGKFILDSVVHPDKTTHSLHGCIFQTFGAEHYPPVVYDTSGTRKGILIEMLTIAAKHLNMSFVNKDEYKYINNKTILVSHIITIMLSYVTTSLFDVTLKVSQFLFHELSLCLDGQVCFACLHGMLGFVLSSVSSHLLSYFTLCPN